MNRIVTASEIAGLVFYPDAHRLALLGHESSNQRSRDLGTAHHARKAFAEKIAAAFNSLGRFLIVVA